jgi:hypothetical protein
MRALGSLIRSLGVVDVVPAIVLAVYGVSWIIVHASARSMAHTVFQGLALAEGVVAILLVRRKALASLLGTLAVFLVVDLEPLTLPSALFALATLVAIGRPRTVAFGIVVSVTVLLLMPHLHGDPVGGFTSARHLAAVVGAVIGGLLLRARSQLVVARAHQEQGGDA